MRDGSVCGCALGVLNSIFGKATRTSFEEAWRAVKSLGLIIRGKNRVVGPNALGNEEFTIVRYSMTLALPARFVMASEMNPQACRQQLVRKHKRGVQGVAADPDEICSEN